MGKVIAISNEKGGVGKTTTTLNLGAALALKGHRVLLIDLDASGSLTQYLSIHGKKEYQYSISDILESHIERMGIPSSNEPIKIQGTMLEHPEGFYYLPSNQEMYSTDMLHLINDSNPYRTLDNALSEVRNKFDYILIDCRANTTVAVINAYYAADAVIIPTPPEFMVAQNLDLLLNTIKSIKNPNLKIAGILLTMVDFRTNHTYRQISDIRSKYHGEVNVFDQYIPLRVDVKDASLQGKSVLAYKPNSEAASKFRSFAKEINRNGKEHENVRV